MDQDMTIATTAKPPVRAVVERTFHTHDGTEIFYRYWPAVSDTARGAIVLFHRGHEHGGRMAHLADELAMPDYAFYAWDARGNGRSGGERGYAPSFSSLVRDIDCFMREITAMDGFAQTEVALIAQSFGAVLAAAWVHDYAPPIRAMVLASPAFSVKLYVPFARQGIALWQKIKGRFFVNSYVKASMLTHDRERIASFETDSLITRPIASNLLVELYDHADRIVADARARSRSPSVSWKKPGRTCRSLAVLPRLTKKSCCGPCRTTQSAPEIRSCVGTVMARASATMRSAWS